MWAIRSCRVRWQLAMPGYYLRKKLTAEHHSGCQSQECSKREIVCFARVVESRKGIVIYLRSTDREWVMVPPSPPPSCRTGLYRSVSAMASRELVYGFLLWLLMATRRCRPQRSGELVRRHRVVRSERSGSKWPKEDVGCGLRCECDV